VPNPENVIGKGNRFKAGEVSNPRGRPKGVKNTSTVIRELLEAEMSATNPVTKQGGKYSGKEILIFSQFVQGVKGNLQATQFLLKGATELLEDSPENAPTAYTEPLLDFIPRLNKRYVAPTHLMPLINTLERIARGESVFLCISVPPRHAKTETLLNFIAWFLRQHQSKTVVYCSYAQRQSESKTLKAQNLIRTLALPISETMANREEFRLTEGGGILTTGVGGALTGQGADVMLIDDPVKNREEAESPVIREKIWGWFEDVAETRLEPNASVVVCMTRWHADDLIGRILRERPEYEYIRIPALADGLSADGKSAMPDVLGRKLDEPLWPARYDFANLDKSRREKAYTFTAMYQGLPTPRGAELFRDCTRYSELPKQGLRYAIGIDLAYTKDRRADYTAIVVMARVGDIWYVIETERWQEEITYTKKRILEFANKYHCRIIIETNGSQKAVYDELKKDIYGRLKPAELNGDKLTRSLALREYWNAGLVQVPNGKYGEFIQELNDFTGVKDLHDDYVDAAVYAFNDLRTTGTNMYTL